MNTDELRDKAEAGERFKAFVHSYLDQHGVPHGDPENPHQKEGCRIGARLDLLFAERERLRIDSGNYRGRCAACATQNMEMLTDTTCVACERDRLRAALEQALEQMDRARRILTDGKPTWDNNWGVLDTTQLRAALSAPEAP